jgi:hypothetical protein
MPKDHRKTTDPHVAVSGRAAIRFGSRPKPTFTIRLTDPLANLPLAREEFDKRVRRLQDLQRKAGEAILTFAVEYAALYQEVARQSAHLDALHDALHLNDRAATRLRTIAAAASTLTPMRDRLPLALDSIYELTLALKEDATLVRGAVDAGQITPHSTLRDVRAFRRLTQANGRTELDTLRRIEHPDPAQQQRRAELESLNRKPRSARGRTPKHRQTVAAFLRWLSTAMPRHALMHSFVQPAVTIDAQFYGTTVIVERFVMTTVAEPYQATDGTWHLTLREDKDRPKRVTGTIPLAKAGMSPEVLDAIRAIYGVDANDYL